MREARALPHRPPIVDWNEVLHDFKGDIRFWLGGFFGGLALVFFLADLFVNVGYLTTLSVFSGKGFAVSALGGIIGIGVAFWVHFGIHRSWTQMQHIAGKIVGTLFTVAILGLSMWFAMTGAEDLWQMDMSSEAQASVQASGLRDTAANDRSTDIEEAAVTRADEALAAASARRTAAEALQVELAGLPAGEYNPRTAEIQSIIGARPDGVKYNLTVDAMSAYTIAQQTAEREADAAYQTALANLTAKRDRITQAAQSELTAVTLESGRSYLRTMRAWAEAALGHEWVQYPSTDEERANNEEIQSTAEQYAKNSGHAIALVVTLGSLLFGLLRFRIKDVAYIAPAYDGPVLDALPEPGPENRPGSGARARYVDDERIEDDAPFQPGRETAEAAEERLERAMARLKAVRKGKAYGGTTDEKASLIEAIAEAEERRQEQAELDALRRQLEEAQAEAARHRTASSAPRHASPSDLTEVYHAITRRMNDRAEAQATQPLTPRPEPEVARNSFGNGHDAFDPNVRLQQLRREFNELDGELEGLLKVINRAPGSSDAMRAFARKAVIEDRLHKIHSEMEPLIAAVNRAGVSP